MIIFLYSYCYVYYKYANNFFGLVGNFCISAFPTEEVAPSKVKSIGLMTVIISL